MPRGLALLILLASMAAPTSAQPPVQPPGHRPTTSLEALAVTLPGEAGAVRSALFFGLSLEDLESELLASGQPANGPGRLQAKASLLKAGTEVDAFEVTAELTADDLEDRRRLQVYGDLEAPPGRYRLSLELRIGEETHSADYPLQLQRPPPDRATVLPPLLVDDEGFVAAFYEPDTADTAADPREPPADYPLFATGEQLVPDIAPRLGVDVPRSRICLIGRALTADKTFLETGMVSEDGTLLSKERLAVVSQDEAVDGGYETLCLGLDTQGLAAGLYQLNVTLHDFERRTTERTELSFEILAD